MLNLAYPFDDTVDIDGEIYELNLAFDNVLRLIDMLADTSLNDGDQVNIGLTMLLGTDLDDMDMTRKEEIFFQLFENTLGKEIKDSQDVDIAGNPMPDSGKADKDYSLTQDAPYIYSSFMLDYGIDLHEVQGELHWEKFKALLGGLSEGSKFMRVIEIRTTELPTGKGTGKQREQMKKQKKQFALEDE